MMILPNGRGAHTAHPRPHTHAHARAHARAHAHARARPQESMNRKEEPTQHAPDADDVSRAPAPQTLNPIPYHVTLH